MKHLTRIIILLWICGCTNESNAQGVSDGFGPVHRGISISTGGSHPIGDFNEFARTGIDIGLAFDYQLSKVWGLGVHIDHQRSAFEMPSRFTPIDFTGQSNYTTQTNSSGNWSTTSFGFGPWWLIQPGGPSGDDGFFIKIYALPGVSLAKSPDASIVLTSGERAENIFTLEPQNKVAVSFTTGAQFNFKLNKNLFFFVNPQFVYTSAKMAYTHSELQYTNNGDFSPQRTLYDPIVKNASFKPSYLNLNVGLTYRIAKN